MISKEGVVRLNVRAGGGQLLQNGLHHEDCFVAGPIYILWSKVIDSQIPPTHCVVLLHRGSGNLTRLLMMSVRMIRLLLTLVAGVQLQSDLRHGEGLFTTSTTIRFLYPLWIYSLNWKMA